MTTQSPPTSAQPNLLQARIKEVTLRRVAYAAAAVILVVAGAMVGPVSPELGVTLIVAGIKSGVEAIAHDHDKRHHRVGMRSRPELALG